MKKKLITSALSLALLSTSISSFAGTDVAEPYIIKFNDEFTLYKVLVFDFKNTEHTRKRH